MAEDHDVFKHNPIIKYLDGQGQGKGSGVRGPYEVKIWINFLNSECEWTSKLVKHVAKIVETLKRNLQ